MINIGDKLVTNIYFGDKPIKSIYDGDKIIFKAWSCVVAGLGSENPNNVTFTHDGEMPIFEEVTINDNVFIKIPKIYRKILSHLNGQITSFEIANYKKDNDFLPYPCFRKEDWCSEMGYILIGKYLANTGVMNSINVSSGDWFINEARTNARALGTGYQLYDWQMQKLWQDLIICKKNTIDTNNGSGIGTDDYDDFGIYWGIESTRVWVDGVIGKGSKWYISYKPSEYLNYDDNFLNLYSEISYDRSTNDVTTACIQKLGYDYSNQFFNYTSYVYDYQAYNFNKYYCDRYYYSTYDATPIVTIINSYVSAAAGAFNCMAVNQNILENKARLCYRPINE